jgi:hypothetical protein
MGQQFERAAGGGLAAHLEWQRVVPEITGKFIGFLLGFFASWFLLFRRHLKALDRLRRGDSDDVLFQAHFLAPVPGTDKCVLHLPQPDAQHDGERSLRQPRRAQNRA